MNTPHPYKNAAEVAQDCRQLVQLYSLVIRKAEEWNGLHPDEPPIDVERVRVKIYYTNKVIAKLESSEIIDATLIGAMFEEW